MWFASNLSQSPEEVFQQNWNKKEKGRQRSQKQLIQPRKTVMGIFRVIFTADLENLSPGWSKKADGTRREVSKD